MSKLPRGLSGKEVSLALQRLGFSVVRQRGSHIILRKGPLTVPVPDHNPVKVGTLKSILQQANITLEDLERHL